MIFSVFLNTELNDLVPTHYVESYEKLGKLVQNALLLFMLSVGLSIDV